MMRAASSRIVGDEAAAEHDAVAVADRHRIAAREAALDAPHADRQQARAARAAPARRRRPRAACRAARARRRSRSCGPSTGFDGVRNQVQRAPSAMRRSGFLRAPVGDDHVGAAGGRDLARLDLGAHAAAGELGGGAARHRLDRRRDALDDRECAAPRDRTPAAPCRGRRCRRAAPGDRRRSSSRRARRGGRCRRSGSRVVATVSFSLMTGTARSRAASASSRGR